MKVRELIRNLERFPEDIEVIVSDGYSVKFYNLDFAEFKMFGKQLDIGVGGCEIKED